jgi:hypothetical protein
MASTRVKTVLKFLGAYETLDLETFASVRSPSCLQTFAPASISPAPPVDNATFLANKAALKDIMTGFPVTANEVMEDQQQNKVIVRAFGRPLWRDEVKDDGIAEEEWDWSGEYMLIFTMDETGEKIDHILEFVDSKETVKLPGLLRRATANKAKSEKKSSLS